MMMMKMNKEAPEGKNTTSPVGVPMRPFKSQMIQMFPNIVPEHTHDAKPKFPVPSKQKQKEAIVAP